MLNSLQDTILIDNPMTRSSSGIENNPPNGKIANGNIPSHIQHHHHQHLHPLHRQMSLSSPKEEDERFLHVNDGSGGRGNVTGGDANSESNSFNSGIAGGSGGGGSGDRPPSLFPGLRRRVPSLARIGHVNSGKRYEVSHGDRSVNSMPFSGRIVLRSTLRPSAVQTLHDDRQDRLQKRRG